MAGNPLKTFACPNCGGTVEVRAAGRSLSVVCPQCLSVIDPNSPQYEILSHWTEKANRISPMIPLGARGQLHGTLFECIGFMVRSDRTNTFSWDEYLLYNPQQGYRWLVISDGHCNFITPLKSPPIKHAAEVATNSFTYNGESYTKFTDEPAVVQFVLGEFYWAVAVGETANCVDFIHPPKMLSFEITKSEIMASVGEYIDANEVTAAFQLKNSLGMQDGTAANQVNPYKADSDKIILMAIPFTFIILVLGNQYSYENMLTFLILLLGYVFWYFQRMNAIEMARWRNSDYKPMSVLSSSSDDSDDD